MVIHAASRRVNLSGAKTLAACCLNRNNIAAGGANRRDSVRFASSSGPLAFSCLAYLLLYRRHIFCIEAFRASRNLMSDRRVLRRDPLGSNGICGDFSRRSDGPRFGDWAAVSDRRPAPIL